MGRGRPDERLWRLRPPKRATRGRCRSSTRALDHLRPYDRLRRRLGSARRDGSSAGGRALRPRPSPQLGRPVTSGLALMRSGTSESAFTRLTLLSSPCSLALKSSSASSAGATCPPRGRAEVGVRIFWRAREPFPQEAAVCALAPSSRFGGGKPPTYPPTLLYLASCVFSLFFSCDALRDTRPPCPARPRPLPRRRLAPSRTSARPSPSLRRTAGATG